MEIDVLRKISDNMIGNTHNRNEHNKPSKSIPQNNINKQSTNASATNIAKDSSCSDLINKQRNIMNSVINLENDKQSSTATNISYSGAVMADTVTRDVQQQQRPQGEFTEVVRRWKRRKQEKVGTNTDFGENSGFSGTAKEKSKKIWIFLKKVTDSANEDNIIQWIVDKSRGVTKQEISAKKVKTYHQRQNNNHYLIGVPPSLEKEVYSLDFWPIGVAFDRFNFRIGQNVIHQNIQSIGNSVEALNQFLFGQPECIAVCITEHWKTKQQLESHRLAGFKLVSSFCRPENKHGGSAVFVSEEIVNRSERLDIVSQSEMGNLECAAVEIRLHDMKMIILSIYRPPLGMFDEFLNNLEHILTRIYNEEAVTKIKKLRRSFSKNNKVNFMNDLQIIKWNVLCEVSESDVDEQWNVFSNIILQLFDFHFPLKTVNTTKKSRNKLFASRPDIKECKKKIDILYVLSCRDKMYTQAYNDVRNVYNKLLVDSRKEHFRNRIVNSDNKTKCVWNIIREIKGHPNDTNVLIPGNSESIANAYNHYILNTTNHLMSKIPYLVLNANKTNLLLFKTKNHSGQVPSMNINLGNDVEFQLVDNTKFLGVYVDETLRWTSHEILLFVFKNRQYFQKFLPTNYYPTRNFNYRFPVHHLTLTEKNVEYSCIKIFNHLPLDLKIVTDLTTFKKKIHKMLIDLEPYCLEDYFK
nr:unnamed protein product [Callosobruchus analis]